MSDSDEETFCMYGRLLEPYDEDEIPSKKPINIEDQIATDAHGRRRFHGAFTGGFSAGFCNTVGSLEGWKPKDFKSSRQEKAEKQTQRPEDFMDDEDVAEFGFAPQGLRTTDEYNSVSAPRKRRFRQPDGPIPGQPVLQLLLEPAKETVGVRLLKRLGWKPGQGVGPRLTKTEKKRVQKRLIGCEMPPGFERKEYSGSESDSDSDTEITFAPDDYQSYICQPKENTCGMGYTGLNKNLVFSGFAASKEPSHFSMVDRNNKVLSIQGQAFGVGAFEEDDEDIYSKDDMSTYDFELGNASTSQNKKAICSSDPFHNFIKSSKPTLIMKVYPPPELPKNFIPKHGARISRFEPLPPEKLRQIQLEKQDGPNRHNLTADDRSKLLNDSKMNEKSNQNLKDVVKTKNSQEKHIQGPKGIKILGGGSSVSSTATEFKPFAANPEKQARYEQYLVLLKNNEKDKITQVQPISMTEWECNQERAEFEQAANMYKPRQTDFLVFDRFVAAKQVEDVHNPLASVESTRYLHGSADMREAAKRKMFGKLTRDVSIWNPASLLCKRFNIPEPYNTATPPESGKKKKNYSVFDYLNALDKNTVNKEQSKVIEKLKDKKTEEQKVTKNVERENNNPSQAGEVTDNASEVQNTTLLSPKTIPVEKIIENTIQIVEERTKCVSSEMSPPVEPTVSSENPWRSSFTPSDFLESASSSSTSEIEVEKNKNNVIAQKVEEPIILHTEEKIDLYKAIFLSSSESESEEETSQPVSQDEAAKATKTLHNYKDALIKDIEKSEPTALNTIPTVTNNTPFSIAPIKTTGIFSNINLNEINSNYAANVKNKRTDKLLQKETLDGMDDSSTYGPQLPKATAVAPKPLFRTIKKLQIEDTNDEWVEKSKHQKKDRDEKSKKKKSHHKKHKKSDKKHKKKRTRSESH